MKLFKYQIEIDGEDVAPSARDAVWLERLFIGAVMRQDKPVSEIKITCEFTPEWLAVVQRPVVALSCCVCGLPTKGRQWPNRDTGYGVCASCGLEQVQRVGLVEAQDLYGYHGIHWGSLMRTKA